jgi:tetratricopeptide (TPR) repeat protein
MGDKSLASARYNAVARDAQLTSLQRAAAEEALADLSVLQGDDAAAARVYTRLTDRILDEDHLRLLDLKRLVTASHARAAVTALLIGDARLGPDWAEAASELVAWAQRDPENALPEFLLGKNFYNQGRWNTAAAHLERALTLTFPLPRFEREALRMRLVVACAVGDASAAEAAFTRWRRTPDATPAQAEAIARLAQRCGVASAR